MFKTIPTFYLYGLDAIPAHVIVEGDRVRVAERGTGRTLVVVKQESDTRKQAGVQLDRQITNGAPPRGPVDPGSHLAVGSPGSDGPESDHPGGISLTPKERRERREEPIRD